MRYIYNKNTHTLHIEGYCVHAKKLPSDNHLICFDTEDEALAYDGRAVGLCKLCRKKRDKELKK